MTQDVTVSVVVPTRDEKDNIGELVARMADALRGELWEAVFVDDSRDEATVEALKRTAARYPQVRFEHRAQGDGLSGAVRRGFCLARGPLIAVMDADLQHPPEVLPSMLAQLRSGADLVVGSRFVPGGSDGGLGVARRFVSLAAQVLIWAGIGRARCLSDPTSGCFAVRRDILPADRLHATGWKILLEVLVRAEPARVLEVPLVFSERRHGESKMSLRQMVDLLRQIGELVWESSDDRRLYLFALVGASGVLLNMAVFLLLGRLGVSPEAGAFGSAVLAMLSNFFLNDRFTYLDRAMGSRMERGLRALLVQAAGIAIDTAAVAALHLGQHWPGILANGFGILAASVWNYGMFTTWVWRKSPAEAKPARAALAREVFRS